MAKFSKRTDAIHAIKVTGMAEAALYLLDEQAKDAELELFQCSPLDPKLVSKLVKAQELRNLEQRLRSELK